jgi:hypothetical protein
MWANAVFVFGFEVGGESWNMVGAAGEPEPVGKRIKYGTKTVNSRKDMHLFPS